MGKVRPSVIKKQREQKQRERKVAKAEKRAEKKTAAERGEETSDFIANPAHDQDPA